MGSITSTSLGRLPPVLLRFAVVWCLALPAVAAPFAVLEEESVFAVVTRKAGVGSFLAHDHLIVASRYQARLDFDEDRPSETSFELTVRVTDLEVDLPAMQARWWPRLHELGLQQREFSALSERRRAKIREAMLGPKQLDAEAFPVIRVAVVAASAREPAEGDGVPSELPWDVDLTVEIHGREVGRRASARYAREEGTLEIEAQARFTFGEFGVKPYSAALGAVRNADEFVAYVFLRAAPTDAASTGHGLGDRDPGDRP